ncbi:MAG: dihydroorotate dehydrogenase electron transfer subunit [Candidatus Hermodarchaeota archaeon]
MTNNMIETVKIKAIIDDCEGVKTLEFERINTCVPKPGQFVMIWIPGVDEIPMSISSYKKYGEWAITVKNVGECTNAIHTLKVGDYIGVRGPLGNSFQIPKEKNKNIFLIGGGIGMAPLRFLASELIKLGYNFTLILGVKEEPEILFINEFLEYQKEDLELHFCTDDGSFGEKAVAPDLFENLIEKTNLEDLKNTVVFTCGPEKMMYKILQICEEKKIEMYASLERIMRCGCGLCGLCVLDPLGLLVCNDGPIFSSKSLMEIEDFGKYKRNFAGKKYPI